MFCASYAAFAQRRKTLSNALKPVPGAREAISAAGIDPQRRGETLSVEEFAAIERAIGPIALEQASSRSSESGQESDEA